MRRTISPLLLATVLVAGFSSIQSTKGELAQKPVKEATTYPSFIGPAATLNETFLSTDLVLRGRVLGSSPRDKPHVERRGTWIRTGHRVKVLEVFRGSYVRDDEITVVQSGGDRDRGVHIERLSAHGFPLLETGKEYVLFLGEG